ncbi:MAG TPA: MDR family MFS transporter, partial [Dehalococcoidia bacterium]|nr:MDR family MFS transporter [Dehalococcoidia bacterium]
MQNLPARQKVVIMAGVLLGLFFSSMNQTVVSTAMPRIIASLGGIDLYSWVFTSFMLTSTTTIPIFGKLSDIYGRKPLYLGGMVVFSIGSVLAGLSQDMTQLIVFRAIQGLGSGGMMAISFTIIGDIFSPAERGKWQGLNSSVFGLSSVIGPLIGGYITDNLSWNWVFYVNLPFGALAFAVIWFGLPWQRNPVKRPVDYFGVMALVGGLVPMLLAFVWGGTEYAWSSPTILGLLAGSASMLIVFVIVEHRAEEPIMPLFLFRHRMFTVSVLATFVAGIAMFATITYMPLFIQGVNSESATRSGIVMMPLMVSMMTASTLTGQIMSRTGKYLIPALVGTVIMGFGIFLASQMDVNSSNGEAMRNMVIIGLGLGPTMPVFIIAVQNAMPYRYMGVVTSNVQFFRQIGGTMGVAIMGSVLNNRISTELDTRLPTEVQEQGSSELLGRLENPQVLLDDSAL